MSRHFSAAALLVWLCPALWGQLANTTALVGNVADQGGAAIPGAVVTAINEGTHGTYSGVTSAEGAYQFQFVRIGTYTVTAESKGFQTVRKTGSIDARRPNPLFAVIRTIQNDEIANYQALNVVLRQRTNHGLTLLLTYTWSHALDVSTDSNGGGAPMDPYNWRGDYGNSNWDVRHRFVASYMYDLPFFQKSSNRLLHATLANWQINGITTIQSGFPFNVTIPGDAANTGVGSQRPNLVAAAHADCGQNNLTNCISAASFAMPSAYTYGNAGRNLLYGPGLINTDFSLFKNIPIYERAKLQIRAEFFNLFNTPSFSNPNAVFGTAAFGSITSTVNNNREIQFAAKFVF